MAVPHLCWPLGRRLFHSLPPPPLSTHRTIPFYFHFNIQFFTSLPDRDLVLSSNLRSSLGIFPSSSSPVGSIAFINAALLCLDPDDISHQGSHTSHQGYHTGISQDEMQLTDFYAGCLASP